MSILVAMNRRRILALAGLSLRGPAQGVVRSAQSLAAWAAAAAAGAAPGAASAQTFNANERPPSPQEQQLEFDRELRKRVGDRPLKEGRVSVNVPALAENGHSVPFSVVVESAMTEQDHVRALHVLIGRNPRPWAITVKMHPGMPLARLDTRLRLAGSGRILAVAEMQDATLWAGFADVQVTLSACVDGS
jgi:sulfur-oxidizing protein SoxY